MSRIKCICDACCHVPNANIKGRSGMGKAACATLVLDANHQVLGEHAEYLGETTTPQAEFRAVLLALEHTVDHTRGEVDIWSDSELVVKWMNGDYKIHKAHIRPLFDQAKSLELRYHGVRYFHHSRTAPLAQQAHAVAAKKFEEETGVPPGC